MSHRQYIARAVSLCCSLPQKFTAVQSRRRRRVFVFEKTSRIGIGKCSGALTRTARAPVDSLKTLVRRHPCVYMSPFNFYNLLQLNIKPEDVANSKWQYV